MIAPMNKKYFMIYCIITDEYGREMCKVIKIEDDIRLAKMAIREMEDIDKVAGCYEKDYYKFTEFNLVD